MGAAYYIVLNRVINFATNNSAITGSTKNKHTLLRTNRNRKFRTQSFLRDFTNEFYNLHGHMDIFESTIRICLQLKLKLHRTKQ